MNSIKLSFPIFILCTILFFLPFVRIDCGDVPKKITGTQLVFGFEDKDVDKFFKPKKEWTRLEIFAKLAFFVSIVGIVFNALKIKNKNLASGFLSLLVIVFLFELKINLDYLAEKEKISVFLRYEWPFWTIIILSVVNIIINIKPLKISGAQQNTTSIETKEGE